MGEQVGARILWPVIFTGRLRAQELNLQAADETSAESHFENRIQTNIQKEYLDIRGEYGRKSVSTKIIRRIEKPHVRTLADMKIVTGGARAERLNRKSVGWMPWH